MGIENPEQAHESHEAELRDELPIPDLDLDPGEEKSEQIRGGAGDSEANSEKIKH
jgi:hypothetical protein